MAHSRCATSGSSWNCRASRSASWRVGTALKFWVPASNLPGTGAKVVPENRTVSIISPPPMYGGIASSHFCGIASSHFFFPYSTPVPVAPYTLCPENA